MTTYTFHLNGTDLDTLTLESCRLSLRAGGPDELTWSIAEPIPATADYPVGTDITLLGKTVVDGEVTATVTLFHGRVVRVPAADTGIDSGHTYTAVNGWGDMRRLTLTQTWKSWDPTTKTLLNRQVPRVVLGQGDDGQYQTTGETITDIISFAGSKGANIAVGTISPTLLVPPTEVVDTSCDQALRQFLAYHPDYIAYIEGDTFNLRPPSALSTITIADPSAYGLAVEHDPQTDDIPGGVTIVWERTHDIDGDQRIERIHQTAGATSGWPPPLMLTIPLAGTSTTSKIQVMETRTLPDPLDLRTIIGFNFFKGLVPQIADAVNDDLGFSDYSLTFADPKLDKVNADDPEIIDENEGIIDHGADLVTDFPRMLVNGQVQSWFPSSVKQYDATLTVRIFYRGADPEIKKYVGTGIQISEPIVITNARPKTYRVADDIEAAEEPISGLAAAYYAAISGDRDDGSISGDLQGQFLTLRPGYKVAITSHFSTAAVIRATTLDLLSKTFSANFGSAEYLNPKTITDLARAIAKNKPTWKRPVERTEAKASGASAGPIKEGANLGKKYPTPTRPTAELWALDVTDPVLGKVKILNPGLVKKTTAYDNTDQVAITSLTSEFTAAAGKLLCLKVVPNLTTTLVMVDEWATWPNPLITEASDPAGYFIFTEYYYVLYQFLASAGTNPLAVKINDTLYAHKRGFNHHLLFSIGRTEDEDSHVVSFPELIPCLGAESPA